MKKKAENVFFFYNLQKKIEKYFKNMKILLVHSRF